MRVWPGNQFRIYAPRSRFDMVFRGGKLVLPPAGPSRPIATAMPGPLPGEGTLTITTAPASGGDLLAYGDGQGAVAAYWSRINGVFVVHETTSLPISRTASGLTEGVPVLFEWGALGSNRQAGASGSAYVTPAAAPSAPSAPDVTATPGSSPGEIDLSIVAPPLVWGDATISGDNAGVIAAYRSRIAGVLAEHDTTSLPINRTATGLAEGVPVLVEAWVLGSNDRPGAIWSALVYPAVTAPAASIWLIDRASGAGLVDLISGRGLVIPEPAED